MKVKYLPHQPHCFAFGGFDLQMLNTLKAVQEVGVDASKLDFWERKSDFEILHVWGLGPHNFSTIEFAKKAGKVVVATVLLPYYDSLRSKVGYYYRFWQSIESKRVLRKIDRVVVLNNLQFEILRKRFSVPASKMKIIPNIVEEPYFKTPVFDFKKKYGIEDYILSTGNICKRKNQYNLALACINLNKNLVIIGNVLDGEEEYGKLIRDLTTKHQNIRWISSLEAGSDELVAGYYHCKAFALPSKSETQPISALEAVAVGKPLLLLDRGYAHQSFYKNAVLSKSPSVEGIIKGLVKVTSISGLKKEPEIYTCRKEAVGHLYKDLYNNL